MKLAETLQKTEIGKCRDSGNNETLQQNRCQEMLGFSIK
jgi:hypothetical protein